MAALALNRSALMVRLPNGDLVPADGMFANASPTPIAGADLSGTGALVDNNPTNPTGAIPGNVINLPASHGGAARAPDLGEALSRKPTVIAPDQGGGSDMGAILAKLAGAIGKSAAGGAIPSSGVNADGQDVGFLAREAVGLPGDASAGAIPAAAAPAQASGGGIMDRLKNFLHGDSGAPTAPDATATPASGAIPSAATKSPDFFERLQNNPMALALITGGLGMMSSASRPGATLGGALAEGVGGGLNAVYSERASQRAEAAAAAKAASEQAYQAAQSGKLIADTGAVPSEIDLRGAQAKEAAARASGIPSEIGLRQAQSGEATARAGAIPSEVALRTAQAGEANANTAAIPIKARADADRAARVMKPIPGIGPDGKTEGMYVPSSVDGVPPTFYPGKLTSTSTGRTGQTEDIIASLRKENPNLSYADALALSKRAPNADAATLRKEGLALSAAKADIAADFSGKTTLDSRLSYWRGQYGLPATSGGGAIPAAPAATSAGALPDRAAALLKEGQNQSFANGQVWTLKSGKPVRVK